MALRHMTFTFVEVDSVGRDQGLIVVCLQLCYVVLTWPMHVHVYGANTLCYCYYCEPAKKTATDTVKSV